MATSSRDRGGDAPPDAMAAALDRARAGDAVALDALLQRLQPQLERHAARSLGWRLRARARGSDILQDAMLEVVRRMREFEGTTAAQFVRWAERIIETCALQQQRFANAQKRRPPSRPSALREVARAMQSPPPTPSGVAVHGETAARYERALASLSPDQRRVIEEVVVARRPVEAIAAAMQRTPAAVHALLSRARAALALRLAADDSGRPRR